MFSIYYPTLTSPEECKIFRNFIFHHSAQDNDDHGRNGNNVLDIYEYMPNQCTFVSYIHMV